MSPTDTHNSAHEALMQHTPAKKTSGVLNPTQLDKPAFLMNVPFSYCTEIANNPWMEDLPPAERQPDLKKAMCQFLQLYHFLASESAVYLLPAPGDCNLQDIVFTANVGVTLPHTPERNTVVVSNFTSPPRIGEASLAYPFFRSLGYCAVTPPFKFEGDAELKHLQGNVYAGGYGIRSDVRAYDWVEEQFQMKVIKLEETEPYLYHLDCTLFPLTKEETLVCTSLYKEKEIKELEQYTSIIDVSEDDCFSGICNSVRLWNTILNASHIHELRAGTEEYASEIQKNRQLEDIAASRGFELCFFNLSEYMKGGALLSCMVMLLNRYSYEIALL